MLGKTVCTHFLG